MTDDLSDSVVGAMTKLQFLPGLLAVGLVLVHCGKTVDEPTDAGKTADATTSTTPGSDAGATDASSFDTGSPTLDAAPDAQVACTTEDASACDTIPPSVCVDGTTLVYFSGGSCVDGTCRWTQSPMPCGAQSYCMNGGCTPPTTK